MKLLRRLLRRPKLRVVNGYAYIPCTRRGCPMCDSDHASERALELAKQAGLL